MSELFEFCQCNFDGVPASSLVSFGNRQMGVRVSMENSDRRLGCVLEQFYEIYFFFNGGSCISAWQRRAQGFLRKYRPSRGRQATALAKDTNSSGFLDDLVRNTSFSPRSFCRAGATIFRFCRGSPAFKLFYFRAVKFSQFRQ